MTDTQQQPLTARIDEQLAATEGHTAGTWCADYVGDNAYLISSVTPGTIDGNLRQVGLITHMPDDARVEDAALIASAPVLRALLAEALPLLARVQEAEVEVARAREVLGKVRGRVRIALDNTLNSEAGQQLQLAEEEIAMALGGQP